MNHTNTQDEAQKQAKPLTPKVKELIANTKSVILATVDAEGTPNSSYAPVVQQENTFLYFGFFHGKTHEESFGRKKNFCNVH
ncbi:MAG: pyridoxamine 5'-phosphate oxidase family protein [Chryseobacterium sp.]